MEIKKSNFLIVVIFASLLLPAMSGHRKLLNKDEARSMETSGSSMHHVQEDEEVVATVYKRILRQVKMDDYGRYNPTPTMSKPHFKDIPN